MNGERIAKMTENIVADEQVMKPAETDDTAHANVDQALDNIIVAIEIIEENLPKMKIENVPQQAAVDATKDLMDNAIKPYLADVIKAMEIFGG